MLQVAFAQVLGLPPLPLQHPLQLPLRQALRPARPPPGPLPLAEAEAHVFGSNSKGTGAEWDAVRLGLPPGLMLGAPEASQAAGQQGTLELGASRNESRSSSSCSPDEGTAQLAATEQGSAGSTRARAGPAVTPPWALAFPSLQRRHGSPPPLEHLMVLVAHMPGLGSGAGASLVASRCGRSWPCACRPLLSTRTHTWCLHAKHSLGASAAHSVPRICTHTRTHARANTHARTHAGRQGHAYADCTMHPPARPPVGPPPPPRRLLAELRGYAQGRLAGQHYAPWQVAQQVLRAYRLCSPALQLALVPQLQAMVRRAAQAQAQARVVCCALHGAGCCCDSRERGAAWPCVGWRPLRPVRRVRLLALAVLSRLPLLPCLAV